MAVRFWALDRDEDVSGISGSGRIAYAIQLATGVLLVWDTDWVTVDWRPDMATLEAIHGHGGATRIVPLDEDVAARAHALRLLARVHPGMVRTAAEAEVLL